MPAVTSAAPAVTKPTPVAADNKTTSLINYLENYLNSLRTLQAKFQQYTSDGGMVTGQLVMQRPGKMRLTYDPPLQDFIVADGDFLNIWDAEMKSSSSVPLDQTLAWFFLRDPISLTRDVQVVDVREDAAQIHLTLAQPKAETAGELVMSFEDRPLRLVRWVVRDATGRQTTVALQNVRENEKLPSGSFVYQPPTFAKPRQSGQ